MSRQPTPAPIDEPDVPGGHDMVDDSRLRQITGYAIRRADAYLSRDFRRHIGGPLGIGEVEFAILELLRNTPALSHKAIAATLAISPPALTVVLERMNRAGWIARRRFAGDRRVQLISASADGLALQHRAAQAANRMETELRARFAPAEHTILMRLLAQLRAP